MIGFVADIERLVIACSQVDERFSFRELKVDLIADVSMQPNDLLRIVGDNTHARIHQASRGRQFRMDSGNCEEEEQTATQDEGDFHELAPIVVGAEGGAGSKRISGSRRYSRMRKPKGLSERSCSSFEGET